MRNISFKNSAYPLLKRLKHHFQVYNFQIAGIEPRTVGQKFILCFQAPDIGMYNLSKLHQSYMARHLDVKYFDPEFEFGELFAPRTRHEKALSGQKFQMSGQCRKNFTFSSRERNSVFFYLFNVCLHGLEVFRHLLNFITLFFNAISLPYVLLFIVCI